MNRVELDQLWAKTFRSPSAVDLDTLAGAVMEVYSSGDRSFAAHVQNRLKQISERWGSDLDTANLDTTTAKLLIADEAGFAGWDELLGAVRSQDIATKPLLFQYAIAAMERGDFSALEAMVGGADRFDEQIREWYETGLFQDEPETLAEVFAAACMLGHSASAAYLLDKGVDPYAGMRTGLSGFHYAASSGRLDVIKLLIKRGVPLEVRNMYGGTVFEQAIWSAVNEHTPYHASIVEALLKAGAVVEPGYLDWWEQQVVPSTDTKKRVAAALRRHGAT